jgi:hypothetical protein
VELPEEEPLGIFVQRKVEWDRNALSYQDFDNGFKRALFTGNVTSPFFLPSTPHNAARC